MLQIPPPKDLLIRLLKQLLLLLIANIKPPNTQPNLPLLIPNINELLNLLKPPQPPNLLINPLLLFLLLLLLPLLITLHPILPLLSRPGLKVFLLVVTILLILLLSILHRYNLITQTLLPLLLLLQLPTLTVRPHLL